MGFDKFYENNFISFKFKQFDITAKLIDNIQKVICCMGQVSQTIFNANINIIL